MSFLKPSGGRPGRRLRRAEGILAAFGWLLLAFLGHAGDFPELRGPYLGQTPPKREAEVFALHESLARHEHWVSVAKTYPSRQLSFELPIDRNTFDRLNRGAPVGFTCRIAALFRGRSVYCAPAGLEIIDHPVGPAPH